MMDDDWDVLWFLWELGRLVLQILEGALVRARKRRYGSGWAGLLKWCIYFLILTYKIGHGLYLIWSQGDMDQPVIPNCIFQLSKRILHSRPHWFVFCVCIESGIYLTPVRVKFLYRINHLPYLHVGMDHRHPDLDGPHYHGAGTSGPGMRMMSR